MPIVQGGIRKRPESNGTNNVLNNYIPSDSPGLRMALEGAPFSQGKKSIGPDIKALLSNILPNEPDYNTESLPAYLLRNIAKTPTLAYEVGRSGMGAGNILDLLTRKFGVPQGARDVLGAFLPTMQGAQEEIEQFLPPYLTKHGPSDRPVEWLVENLPLISSSALTGGVPAALNALKLTGGALAGSEVGGYLGRKGAEILRSILPEGKVRDFIADEELLGAAGGLYGGRKGAKIATHKKPSQLFGEKVHQKETAAAHSAKNKAQQLVDQAQEAKDKANFNKNIIRNERDVRENRKNALPEIQEKNYSEAKMNEKAKPIKGNRLIKVLNDAVENSKMGLDSKDKRVIKGVVKDIKGALQKKSPPPSFVIVDQHGKPINSAGKSSINNLELSNAKKYQKNINGIIHNKKTSPNLKRNLYPIVEELNRSIETMSSPEHLKPWQLAESATSELKNLQKTQTAFDKKINQRLQVASENVGESKANLREAKSNQKLVNKKQDVALENLGNDGTAYLRNKGVDPNSFLSKLENYGAFHSLFEALKGNPIKAIGSYSISKIGQLLNTEKGANKYVMSKHPELYAEGKSIMKNLRKGTMISTANNINSWNRKIEKAKKELGISKPSGRIVSGGIKKRS